MSIAMAMNQHGSYSPEMTVSATGRLRQQRVSDTDRNYAIAAHLSPFLGFLLIGPLAIIAPIVVWVIRKDESPFADDHGREVVNFCISFMLLHLVLGLTLIGVVAYPVLWIVGIVNIIRGSVAASRSEFFRYPMTIRFMA